MRSFVAAKDLNPLLVAIAVAPDAPTRQFLKIKERVAGEIGIRMETVSLDASATGEAIKTAFVQALARAEGIVIQLPLPPEAPLRELLSALPSDLDPDCLGIAAGELLRNDEHIILPPVVAAIADLVRTHDITLAGKRAVVVGQGKLVGAPASLWLERQGAAVTRLTRADSLEAVGDADILVLGAGVPGLITPAMLKEGVVIFDAGTSEEGGKVVGDADPTCAAKASLLTPVPGGIGPMAVAELFGNLLTLQFDYEAGA